MGVKLLLVLVVLGHCCIHSPYKKHSLKESDTPLSDLKYERATLPRHVKTEPTFNPTRTLNYESYELITYRFIGAGASGEVFQMQNLDTVEFQVLKRYFKEGRFQQENYIMHQMGYPIRWARDPIYNNTVSIFPWTQSRSLSQVLLDGRDIKLVMFKILRELNKTVNKGFFHMDIKPLNIIVDTVYEDGDYVTKTANVIVIDWNLVNFYYEGAQYHFRRGTSCYQAPELMIWAKYYTPNVDVWSLGVTMFYLITGKKHSKGCSKDNLGGLIRFVGYDRFMEFYNKIGVETDKEILKTIKQNKDVPGDRQIVIDQNPSLDQETIDILNRMLVLDPLERASFQDLLQDPYFDDVKRLSPPYFQKEKKKKAKRQELMNMAQNLN